MVLAAHRQQVFTREVLAAVEWLTQQAWQVPWSRRVDSLTNFQHTEANGDDLFVHDLVEQAESLSDTALAAVKSVVLTEPLLLNRLISPDADVTAVNVTVQIEQGNAAQTAEAMDFTFTLRDAFRQRYPFIDLYLTGGVVMDHAFPEATLSDVRRLIPLVYVVIFSLCCYCYALSQARWRRRCYWCCRQPPAWG